MLGAQRKAFLLKILDRDGRVVAKSVAAELGISEDSIRRDLRELAEAGALIRVYGGALPVPPADRPMQERHALASDSKNRVAAAAIEKIHPGMTIGLDAGTTALALARMLPRDPTLTVVTPSPHVAIAVAEHSDARVIMIGGELARFSMVASGALAMEAVRHLRLDAFFLGVTGIDPVSGLTTGHLDDAITKRAIAERSDETFVLGSEEKVGAVSRYPVIGLDEATDVILDPLDDRALVEEIRVALTGSSTQ